MNILIAKANENILTELLKEVKVKKIEFIESSKSTSFFRISENKYEELYNKVKEKGYNPFALMAVVK